MHLFTYGTLMFPEVWRAVLGDILVGRDFASTPAHLSGYQIFRVASALYPGITAAISPPTSRGGATTPPPSGSQPSSLSSPPFAVPGLLYLDLDAAALARLDAFEGPEYIRQTVTVTCDDGRELAAEAYIVPAENRHLLTNEIWTAEDFLARGHLAKFIARFSGFNRLG